MNADRSSITANFGSLIGNEANRLFPGWSNLADVIGASGLGVADIAMISGKIARDSGLKNDVLEPLTVFLATYAMLWAVIGARAREQWVLPRPSGKPN